MTERGGKLSPEVRTAAFFQQDVMTLADLLIQNDGIVIAAPNSNRKIQLVEVEPFKKSQIGERYHAMFEMRPGDVWNPPTRRINQTLIVAQDRRGIGACVRLLRANYFDARRDEYVQELRQGANNFGQREGDIAYYLKLTRYDRSRLAFLDSSDTLYIIKEARGAKNVTPDSANKELVKLIKGQKAALL